MSQQGKILIVDDNKSIISSLEILLRPEFEEVKGLSSPNQLTSELRAKDYNLVILDMNFSAGINNGNEGLYWLSEILRMQDDLSVVMITAYGDVELAVEALKKGAVDFIAKPWDNSKLLATVKSAVKLNLSKSEVGQLKRKQEGLKQELNVNQQAIIGSSPSIQKVLNLVAKVAQTDANILITGENGTGKELIAREIHRLSSRSSEVMVSVDMGAVNESLFDSELFGHVKGAFTDAKENRMGKFEAAHKGSLFLDEIGNLSFALQAKVLTAVQNRCFMRVGSEQKIPVDIRLICATNKDLDTMVREGLFREDLLYRINTIHIEVPPLRDRGRDILLLAQHFLEKYRVKYGKPQLQLNESIRTKLMKHSWPGNVRELEHSLEKAVILSDADQLFEETFVFKKEVLSQGILSELTLEEMERQLIANVLEKSGGNMSLSAEKLGVTRQTLYNKIKKYQL